MLKYTRKDVTRQKAVVIPLKRATDGGSVAGAVAICVVCRCRQGETAHTYAKVALYG